MGETLRKCKKCLLRDMDRNEYFESLKQEIEPTDPYERTPEELYETRLKTCTECERFTEGMCMVCGCFVEYRAAKTSNYCPDIKKYW